jgi:hypothetical protein
MAADVPLIVAVNVRQDFLIVILQAIQLAGDIAVQIVAEHQFAVGVVHARAV